MAGRHQEGVRHIILKFSEQRRGRLWEYRIGTFRALHSNTVVKVGQKDIPDCFGFTFPTAVYNAAVATFVEVKTKAHPYLTKGQRAFMEFASSKNCKCIVLREEGDGWKEYSYGEKGFYRRHCNNSDDM